MSAAIGKTRYGCNLQGALSTLAAVNGIVPIIHGTAGLGIQNFAANKNGNGTVGALNGYSVPSTNIYEKQIVFGGGSRLREQIKNTVKIIDGQLYIILSGVESEMVSDDVVTMTQEIIDQGYPAAYYKAPGFRGHARIGYEEVVNVLLDYVITNQHEDKKEPKAVNIFGIIPQQDLYWQGNIREIERLLTAVGIKVNRLFGDGQDLTSWMDIPKASLNIVLSKWGLKAADKLKNKYNTPYLFIENTGLGPDADEFIKSVGNYLYIDENEIINLLNKEKNRFNYILHQFAEYYFSYDLRKKIAIVGEESKVIRYGNFLNKYLGMQAETVIITDYHGEAEDQTLSDLIRGISPHAEYNNDTENIEDILTDGHSEIIFGSELEAAAAHKLNAKLFIIGTPQNRGLAVSSSDIGYDGAISLIEKLSRIGR